MVTRENSVSCEHCAAAEARAVQAEQSIVDQRVRRIERSLKAGQLLGPAFDGAGMEELAAEIVRLRALVPLPDAATTTTDAEACHCGPRECLHPVNLRPGFRCKVQSDAATTAPRSTLEGGIGLIAAERKRQQTAEGWTPTHDDEHRNGEMAVSAARYALHDAGAEWPEPPAVHDAKSELARAWQWQSCWWKPKDPIRNLVRAGALIAAEIDRRLRAGSEGDALTDVPAGQAKG